MLNFHTLTIFPQIFDSYINESIIKRAIDKKIITFKAHNLRDFANNEYKQVDDKPFGGGPGMVMMVEPIYKALKEINAQFTIHNESDNNRSKDLSAPKNVAPLHSSPVEMTNDTHTILLSAKGKRFTQKKAQELSKKKNIILICGRYEGVDARVEKHLVDESISVGNYVLTGGELPALTVIDAVTRLLPGVLGNEESSKDESFSDGKSIEYPQYTRPADFKGWKVPDILLSGDHGKIEEWREENKK